MPDYARGKIYKITSGDLTYIGSTCEPTLAKRLAQHVKDYKRWKDGKRGSITSFQVLALGNYEITLLGICPCGSKDELTARERYWIETIPCVNKVIPGRTQKEYKEDHREQIIEKKKKYREDHNEQISEKQKKYTEDHKEELNDYKKKYREDHKEQINEYKKKYNEEHNEQISERCKAYYLLNKEKINKTRKEKRLQKSQSILE